MTAIDLNADLGEGYDDAAMMPFLSSANVACGGHAGDETTMRATIAAALRHRVTIGAHPSYADRAGFGRRALEVPADELEESIRGQVSVLARIAAELGVSLRHVKPHGALYNRAAQDPAVARTVARAVASLDPTLRLVGLAGSRLRDAAFAENLAFAAEAFADRGYAPDGSLAPRGTPGALLDDPHAAAAQAVAIVRDRHVVAVDGTTHAIVADTICLHGDAARAVEVARAVRDALIAAGIRITPLP